MTGRLAGPTCTDCREWPPALRFARSACLYEPPADELVHALKYHGWRVAVDAMVERMAAVRLPAEVEREARICVPVPTAAARRRQRGYDQAALLARAYARLTGRDFAEALLRSGNAVTQTALQPVARGANVAGGFRAAERVATLLTGAHVLLVDDVLTTGATAAECVRTLTAAGVRCVSLITFARALVARSRT
jgi:ComF family protein